MIKVKEAYQSLKKFIPNPKVINCFLCDHGYIFILDMNNRIDNGFFVKSTGGVRPMIPQKDLPTIIKKKEASEYLDE